MSRTPEEQKVLDATAAALAAGEDPFGDDEELVRDLPTGSADTNTDPDDEGTTTTTTTTVDEGEGTTTPADDTTTTPAAKETQTTAAQPDPLGLEQPTRFNAEPPKDYKVQRDALTTEKATAMKQLMDGEIDAEQYAALDSSISEKLETLMAARIRSETLQEANVQNDAAYQQREIRKLIRATAAEVPYGTDATAVKQFDRALQLIQGDPENAERDYVELINEAHRTVAALRGVQLKTPTTTDTTTTTTKATTDVPDRSSKENMPVTLRGLPSASTANTGGGVTETMERLHGPEYQAAWSKLTPQQRAMMLDEA